MSRVPPRSSCCPNCGAALGDPPSTRCADCGWWGARDPRLSDEATPASPGLGEVNPYAPPRAEVAPAPVFRLNALIGMIAVAAVLVAVTATLPVIGIALAVVAIPAMIRTSVGLSRRYGTVSVTTGRLASLFVTSLAISALTVFSMFLAFCVTCFPIGLATFGVTNGGGVIVGVLAGLVASGFVVWQLAKRVWPVAGPYASGRRDIVFLDEPPQRDDPWNPQR